MPRPLSPWWFGWYTTPNETRLSYLSKNHVQKQDDATDWPITPKYSQVVFSGVQSTRNLVLGKLCRIMRDSICHRLSLRRTLMSRARAVRRISRHFRTFCGGQWMCGSLAYPRLSARLYHSWSDSEFCREAGGCIVQSRMATIGPGCVWTVLFACPPCRRAVFGVKSFVFVEFAIPFQTSSMQKVNRNVCSLLVSLIPRPHFKTRVSRVDAHVFYAGVSGDHEAGGRICGRGAFKKRACAQYGKRMGDW